MALVFPLQLAVFLCSVMIVGGLSKDRTWSGPTEYINSAVSARDSFGFTACGSHIYGFGGRGSSGKLNDLFRFDPSKLTWMELSGATQGTPPSPRYKFGFASASQSLYVFGGKDDSDNYLGDFFSLDLSKLEWVSLASTRTTGPTASARSALGLATIQDSLYLFGGKDINGNLNDFFKFDVKSLTWTDLSNIVYGPFPSPRDSFGITSAAGKLYIFGGGNSRGITNSEIFCFDPSLMTWNQFTNSEILPPPLQFLALTSDGSQTLYLCGGGGQTGQIEFPQYSYDLTTMQWSDLSLQSTGSRPPDTYGHGLAMIKGQIFVFAGNNFQSGDVNDLFRLDASLSWTELSGQLRGEQPSARSDFGMVSLGETMYLFAGRNHSGELSDMYSFDAFTLSWEKIRTPCELWPVPRHSFGFTAADSILIVFGGERMGESYVGSLPSARRSVGIASIEEKVFIFGGMDDSGPLNDFYCFDLSTLSWNDLSMLVRDNMHARFQHGMASVDNKLILFGGINQNGILNDVHIFDVGSSTWTELRTRGGLIGLAGHTLIAERNKIFCFGGYQGNWGSGAIVTGLSPVNDLVMLDLKSSEWVTLNEKVGGALPRPRYGHGLTSIDGVLYLFGGWTDEGELTNELFTLIAPAEIVWSEYAGADAFIDTYDWDSVILNLMDNINLSSHIELCLFLFPCYLRIDGSDGSMIRRSAHGRISCSRRVGCTGVIMESVTLVCDDETSDYALIHASDAIVRIENSNLGQCRSASNGAILQSQGNTTVSIVQSSFWSLSSLGFGGAVTALGGTLQVSTSTFRNCTSDKGGGAISVMEYQCAGSTQGIRTFLSVESSHFEECRSQKNGGAVLMVGASVSGNLLNSSFTGCTTGISGGAISINEGVVLTITSTLFDSNAALGLGGGALHSQDSPLILQNISCTSNTAIAGGGGAIFWMGSAEPQALLWCHPGSFGWIDEECQSDCVARCRLCSAGHFQTGYGTTECTQCRAGTYLTASGTTAAVHCTSCESGTFSSMKGASNQSACEICKAGTHSEIGASVCISCAVGTYSTVEGAPSNLCMDCGAGTYLSSAGASSPLMCMNCPPGTYADAGNGASSCIECEAGKYSSAVAASAMDSCILCEHGKYSNISGATSFDACSSCELGQYAVRKCYSYFWSTISWAEAEADCVSKGGHLASILNDEENEEVLNVVPAQFDYWIGYYFDRNSKTWLWSDGSNTSYSNWAAVNPKRNPYYYGCGDIPAYHYSTQESTGMIVYWPWFEEEYGFVENLGPFSFEAGAWYNYDCTNGNAWVNGHVCSFPCAQFCRSCPSGKFLSSSASDSPDMCIPCASCSSAAMARDPNCIACDAGDNSTRNQKQFKLSFMQQAESDFERNDMSTIRRRRAADADEPQINGVQMVANRRSGSPASNSLLAEIHNVCVIGNSAVYGDCIATSFISLDVSGLPNHTHPAFSGLPFSVSIFKQDFYGQVITTDSLSILQTRSSTSLCCEVVSDSAIAISGLSVASLHEGVARFSIILKPTFYWRVGSNLSDIYATAYILFQGIDSEADTIIDMQSKVLDIPISGGEKICPLGHILLLDQARMNSNQTISSPGSCSICLPGTYSVSPLAGYTLGIPSCFICPAGAVTGSCTGGHAVKFTIGVWIVSKGRYVVTACPAGYQLMNSVNGLFSHDFQQCFPCQTSQYVLNSNMSNLTCQICPTGATCDGANLRGLVEKSIWTADYESGVYRLVSCPPGYELLAASQVTQQCALCAATYYCLGGTSRSVGCPEGSFSRPGANSSDACMPSVFVLVSLFLSVSSQEFTKSLQADFQEALASAAAVEADNILIQSISDIRRSRLDFGELYFDANWREDDNEKIMSDLIALKLRLEEILDSSDDRRRAELKILLRSVSSTGTQIQCKIATPNRDSSNAIISKVSQSNINAEFFARGLPQAILISVSISNSVRVEANPVSLSMIIGVTIGGFICFWIVLIAGYRLWLVLHIEAARVAFLAAFRNCKVGDKASSKNLPHALRKSYEALSVIGKGAFGCVLQAKTRQGNRTVAVKIIVPEKGIFHERETRHLHREANALDMFTVRRCEHAVQLAGVEALHIKSDVCWFVMEYILGENLDTVIHEDKGGPLTDLECIKAARDVLAALKILHSEGLIHRDIKPANIMRTRAEIPGKVWNDQSYKYKLVDFGTVQGVDETLAKGYMMTLNSSRPIGVGTLPYMSPEMFFSPEKAFYPTDIWSLGVTMYELVTCTLPFGAESDLLISLATAGNMTEKSPSVLDSLPADRRSTFDKNLAHVIEVALEKDTSERFQSIDEMHDALYCCLIHKNEAFYSVFISYRVASEQPFARLLFDALNHSVTPGGHRVTVFWDAFRLTKGEDWKDGFATGLLNSLCFFPLMSYGSTAPLADLPEQECESLVERGWEEKPCGRSRLRGAQDDPEDNVLTEFLIAQTLLEQSTKCTEKDEVSGMLQSIYPLLIGRQHPPGHPQYPRMGSFFAVQAGAQAGKYSSAPSPATNQASVRFLQEKAGISDKQLDEVGRKSVASILQSITALQKGAKCGITLQICNQTHCPKNSGTWWGKVILDPR